MTNRTHAMQKVALAQTLARQWMGFAIVLSLLFSVMTVLALYMLEDHFLDTKLRSVAQTIDTVSAAPSLPQGFSLYPDHALPADLQARFAGRSDGAHSEFRRADGQYVHALRARSHRGESFLLIYDVTHEMTVNRVLANFWLLGLLLILLFALLARLLARWFMMRWSDSATRLIEQIRHSDSPSALSRYAELEPVQEFAELAQRNAAAWQEKIDALAREQELLAFLNHELRTPLQSARTNLEGLQQSIPGLVSGTDAWSRLTRAITRLERVSRSIRWLSDEPVEATEVKSTAAIGPLLDELLNELQPLAARKGVSVRVERHAELTWPVPVDVADTLLANLLLNALQHGDGTEIVVEADSTGVVISNDMSAGTENTGSGLGLVIVQRWSQRFGMQVTVDRTVPSHFTVRVCPAQ